QPKIPLYVAPKVVERVNPLLTEDEGEMRLAEAFDIVVVEPGEEHHIGPFRMATAPMQHTVPTIGVRVEGRGGAVAYSADTGPTDEVTGLASQADVFVVEASWQGDRRDDQPPIHLTARQAGEIGATAGVGRMLLTHIRPYMDEDRSREEAAAAFSGDVRPARDNETLRVGG
ncbi:MAG: MBL fold metallo-hydrolase, partial [Actinomycetota bacterium]|nr:MBL fold metallo-hydrolase [Actinomycetota bacterium]